MREVPQPKTEAGRGRRRFSLLVASMSTMALLATVCGPSAVGASTNSKSKSGSSAAKTSGLKYAERQLAKYEHPSTKFKAPGPALSGVSSLKGDTMWYVPIAIQVPFFNYVIAGMKSALASLGMHLHVCNGNASPSTIAQCLNQAVGTKAAAVVTDSINYTLAPTAFSALTSSGIPVVLAGQGYPKKGNDTLSYISYNGPQMLALAADAIIAKSKGKANVLIAQIKDTPFTADQITSGAVPQFKKYCKGCSVTVVGSTTAQYSQFKTLVATAITKDPGIDYALPQFDSTITGVVQGLNSVQAASRVKMASTTGTLAGLQDVKSGKLIADVGFNTYEYGYADVDQALRMILKQPVVQSEVVPLKIFTSKNVKRLQINTAGASSGAWYGTPKAYVKGFSRLWGVGG